MLLTVEKTSEEKYVTLVIDMRKLITNTWTIMIKIKNCHILNIVMWIIYVDGQCHKSCMQMTFNELKIFLNLMKI